MDFLTFLKRAPLNELLQYAQSNGIQTHSQIAEAVIAADIAKASNLRPYTINRLNLMGGMIANEIGMNIKEYKNVIPRVRQFYQERGIPHEYLNIEDMFIYGIICYENKIPLFEELRVQLGTYWEFQADFSHGPIVYNDYAYGSFQDYLEYNPLSATGAIYKILYYQSVENLLAFVKARPKVGVYFETFKGLITHIITVIKPKPEEIYSFFSRFHNKYQDRARLVTEYVEILGRSNPIIFTGITELSTKGPMAVLSIPPLNLEERLVRSKLNVSQERNLLLQVFPEMSSESNAGLLADQFFNMSLIDFDLQPTRQDLVQLFGEKNPILKRISEFYMKQVTGWANPSAAEIRNNIDRPEFKQLFVAICPNPEDSYDEPIVEPIISYGTFTNFICYNLAEFLPAFRCAGTIAFRHPDEPAKVFNSREMDQLINILEHIPGTDELIGVITNNRVPFIGEISTDPVIRQKIVDIFKHLFEAGMYQRRWKGPGHPYPMRYEETREGTLIDVEVDMTPSLGQIRELVLSLPKSVQEDLFSIPTIGSNLKTSSRTFGQFFDQTIRGKWCIGFGNATMVFTGYYYLKALRVFIPNFNIEEFDARSTHRVQGD